MLERTVAAGMVQALMQFAVSRGASQAALAERTEIGPAQLEDHDNRIPFANYVALVKAGADLCNDPAFAMHFAESVDLSEFSVVGLLMNASETMTDAFTQLGRYGRLVVEADIGTAERFALDTKDGGLWLVDTRAFKRWTGTNPRAARLSKS